VVNLYIVLKEEKIIVTALNPNHPLYPVSSAEKF
jgi:hypothetical protein